MAGLGWSWWRGQLADVVRDPDGGVTAQDRSDRPLWSREEPGTWIIGRSDRFGGRFAATVRAERDTPSESHRLLIVDRKGVAATVPLPAVFPRFDMLGFADRYGTKVLPLDTDGDGTDELILSRVSALQWPSENLVYSPSSGRLWRALVASGHFYPLAAVDLDDDGRMELLFAGINNRMGWNVGIAAVRGPRAPRNSSLSPPPGPMHAITPGDLFEPINPGLVWYASLSPDTVFSRNAIQIDRKARTIRLVTMQGSHQVIDFDGFPLAPPSALDPSARETLRREADRMLFEAERLADGTRWREAHAAIDTAIDHSVRAALPALEDWARRVAVTLLARSGGFAQAEEQLASLASGKPWAADIAFDVAEALYLAGAPRRAAEGFEHIFGTGGSSYQGRKAYEFLLGLAAARLELGEVDAIDRALARARSTDPTEAATVDAIASWARWRTGRGLTGTPAPELLHNAPDQIRLLVLETRWRVGVDPRAHLDALEAELARTSEECRALVGLLIAELLAELDDPPAR